MLLFALLLGACGATAAARAPSRGSALVPDASGGEAGASAREDGYALVRTGVWVREGELRGLFFLEVVLGAPDPSAAMPLLVVLHGLGDRPALPVGPYEGLSGPVRVVLPRGPLSVGDGFAWMSVRVADGRLDILTAELAVQVERVAAFVTELRRERATLGPTVVTGFSQGGMLTLGLAARHPALVGLALPLAGWLPPALRADAPPDAPRIVWLHGTEDERIAFALAEEAAEGLRARGFDVELVPAQGEGHAMSERMDATFHRWLERVLSNLTAGVPLGEGLPLP